MKLLGVIHELKYLGETCKCIDNLFKPLPCSMMVELPANWSQLLKNTKIRREISNSKSLTFFSLLANRYKLIGSKIIYGDVESIGLKLSDEERQAFMIQRIKETNPELVVVGRNHAEAIKLSFPNVYYIAFADKIDPYESGLADKVDCILY